MYTTSKQKTLTPAGLCENLADRSRVVKAIGFNNVPDLAELELDALVGLGTSIVVQLLKDSPGFIPAILLAKPTRTLLEEPDAADQDDGGNTLERQGKAP